MSVRNVEETFYELTGIQLSNVSQLKLFNILQDIQTDERFMNIFRSYRLNEDITTSVIFYDLYEVQNNDWWDNISFEFYDTPHLWWVIALMNDVTNPFEELTPGDTIKILRETYLYNIFKDMEDIASR